MRAFQYLWIAFLFSASPAKAGALLPKPGKFKIIAEYSQSRSKAIFNENGKAADITQANQQLQYPELKKEGNLHIEIGVLSKLALIAHAKGGQQKFFRREGAGQSKLNWQSADIGIRLQLYQDDWTLSLENSYGYRREDISSDSPDDPFGTEEGFFIDAALLAGIPWYLHRHIHGFVSVAGRWQSHYQNLEYDLLIGEAGVSLNLSRNPLAWRILLFGDVFVNAEISRSSSQRIIEYKAQPSIVVFPVKHVGLQIGTRWVVHGQNASRGFTSFVKVWLDF